MNNLLNNIKSIEPQFIELIHNRFGLAIHPNQVAKLTKTIAIACNKLNCLPAEYLQKLQECPGNFSLLADLISAITVGESYFFRDKNQMQLLEKNILPHLIQQKKKDRVLRIWSAGCSTGEEIYSIAILLCELIPDIDTWNLHLLGTDINVSSLEKAAAGNYGQWSMRSISKEYMQRYFFKNNCHYLLSSQIRKLVRFKYLNLNDNSYPSLIHGINKIDLILCRNVLIYFDNALVAQVMKKISACMADEAYLFLGASDPVITTETNLVFHHDGAIYFSLGTGEAKKDFA